MDLVKSRAILCIAASLIVGLLLGFFLSKETSINAELNSSRNHMGKVERGKVNIALVFERELERVLKVKTSEMIPLN